METRKKNIHRKHYVQSTHLVNKQTDESKKLYRSKNNQMIAGVCAGLGDYFAIDPTVIRLIFVLATIFGGFGIPIYIVLWIILPEVESGKIGSEETVKKNVTHMQARAEGIAAGLRAGSNEGRTRFIFGLILIGLGIVFFLDNFGFYRADIFWPLILVVIGIFILRR
jgi:phage shock protein C